MDAGLYSRSKVPFIGTSNLTFSRAQSLLCKVLAADLMVERTVAARRLCEEIGDKAAFALAQRNHVASSIAHALIDAMGVEQVPRHWRQVHLEAESRISAYLTELDHVARRLSEDGVRVILLENGALARAVYPCPGCFDFDDLDLLVDKTQNPIIHQVLTSLGYTAPADSLAIQGLPDSSNGRVEYARMLPGGCTSRLNIQWSLVARRWFDQKREPDFESLMERSLTIPNSLVRMLGPEDSLFQLSVHSASHTYVREPGILVHLDIERFLRQTTVNWDVFAALVERYRVKTSVYFSLLIPKILFQTPIPDRVLDRLKPPAWKEQLIRRWLVRIGLFDPDDRKFSHAGHILFNALLHDDLGGIWRAVFPSRSWMRERYAVSNDMLLPLYHGLRLFNLVFRRLST